MEMLLVFCYVYLVTQRADELSDIYPMTASLTCTGLHWRTYDGVVFYFAYSDVHNVVDSVTMDQMSGWKLLHVCP